MRKMGLKVVLLSGDTQGVTSAARQALGVDQAMGEFLPNQKAK
jgi:cation transport ATPase